MGTDNHAGDAGARSVNDSPSLAPNERPSEPSPDTRNDDMRGLELLFPGSSLVAHMTTLTDAQLRKVRSYFEPQGYCHTNLHTLAKLLSYVQDGQMETEDFRDVGWLLYAQATALECRAGVVEKAEGVLQFREERRQADMLDQVNAGMAAGDDILQAHRKAVDALRRFKRTKDGREIGAALKALEAAEEASARGYMAAVRTGVAMRGAK